MEYCRIFQRREFNRGMCVVFLWFFCLFFSFCLNLCFQSTSWYYWYTLTNFGLALCLLLHVSVLIAVIVSVLMWSKNYGFYVRSVWTNNNTQCSTNNGCFDGHQIDLLERIDMFICGLLFHWTTKHMLLQGIILVQRVWSSSHWKTSSFRHLKNIYLVLINEHTI